MLNKQGLFSRNQTSSPHSNPISSPVSPAPLNTKSEPSPIPGHMAAVASASTPKQEPKPAPSVHADVHTGSRLIVGPDVKLKGAEIQDCDILVVEGRVEATMDSRVIQIAAEGSFSGKVGIDVAEVHGNFDGELTARSQLIIHATGRVSGKIRYGKIFIEEGGELSGDIASLSSEESSKVKRIQSAS
ncbi:polymer-forming cytoskeletal protein [Methylobacillus gramineus]|uniref:bactofilin family protein n=1 Tax=Methylobacillus gramineus TaxID=755169 RepID=UPI001CFF98B9|nr:polymer-forming cytoskeletal protein [Methylobacillus gramineus]MCB5184855.1 polymer-forming cytoskeletal protein [Methylobacillus gramineus]